MFIYIYLYLYALLLLYLLLNVNYSVFEDHISRPTRVTSFADNLKILL